MIFKYILFIPIISTVFKSERILKQKVDQGFAYQNIIK